MSEQAAEFGRLAFGRGMKLLDEARGKYPDMDDFQLTCLMAVALGCAMGRQSFPHFPDFEMEQFMGMIGASAALAMAQMQDMEKKTCLGRA